MALIDDLNEVTTRLNADADSLTVLVPQLQAQITGLQAQVTLLEAQLAAGLTAAQGAPIVDALNAVELKFKALIP